MRTLCTQLKRSLVLSIVLTMLCFNLTPMAMAADGSVSSSLSLSLSLSKNSADANQVKKLAIDSSHKDKLSEPKKKLGTDLLRLVDDSFLLPNQNHNQAVSQMRELKQFISKTDSVKTIDKRVTNKVHADLVYVYINLDAAIQTSAIDSAVWKVTDRDEKNHLAVALVETNKLEALASLAGVRSVQSVLRPVTNSGSVLTEGDIIHQTDKVRATYSQGGAGMKIGVISDGVSNIASAKNTGDLPSDVTVLSNSIGGDEGTAMLEIIHDMAPDANLYFHDAGSNVVAFNAAVDSLVAAGANVIVDDIAWIGEPFFEDGAVASHVASVLASKNIVYISSAGNYAQQHYQGNYLNGGSNFQDFSSGSNATFQSLYVHIPPGGNVGTILQWNDSFGHSGNNYDLALFNMNGFGLLAFSGNPQTGINDPIEVFSYTNTTGSAIDGEIDVHNFNGLAATKTLELFIYPDSGASVYSDNITPADSIFGQAAVPGVIAVGAISANNPGNSSIEPYSSQGPVTIIGQGQRAKPDIAGIDCVSVTGVGGFGSPFCGTSAAAPAVAAITAQLWAQYPTATGTQIRNQILNTAVDLGTAGTDTVFGHGRADSLLAFQAGPAIISFNFASLAPQATGVINSTNHTIALTVPFGTNITTLMPTIVFTGASVSPSSGVAQNFTSPVTYTVTAASGLVQAYTVTVTVTPPAAHIISGSVKYYDGVKVVPGVILTLSDASTAAVIATTTTSVTGTYQFTNVTDNKNYILSVSSSDTSTKGLSGADQGKIGRHIVHLELFDSIYKIISGDVNNSGGLSGADQGKIGRFIVHLDANLPSGTWKFYPSSAILTLVNYLTAGQQSRTYTNLTADMLNQDFVGIKMGDVNNSWVSN